MLSNLETTCQLTFHGSAANSCPHSLLWVRAPPSTTNSLSSTTNNCDDDNCNNTKEDTDKLVDTIIYASSGIINIATSYPPPPPPPPSSSCTTTNNAISNYYNVTSVNETLVTRTLDYSLVEAEEGESKKLARGEAVEDAAAARSITALSWVSNYSSNSENNSNNNDDVKKEENEVYGIIAAYSDGTVTSHRYHNNSWNEHVIVGNDPCNPLSSSTVNSTTSTATNTTNNSNNTNDNRIYIHNYQESLNQSKLHESISDISCLQLDYTTWLIVTTSCVGIYLHISYVTNDDESSSGKNVGGIDMVYTHEINGNGFASVELLTQEVGDNQKTCYLFAGSASPKNNKIYVYTIPYCTTASNVADSSSAGGGSTSGGVKKEAWVNLPSLEISEPIYHGNLLGHQDWITCFSWLTVFNSCDSNSGGSSSLLASSGHDAKIRLWKFTTYTSTSTSSNINKDGENDVSMLENKEEDDMAVVVSDSDDDEANIDDLEEEEGEARLVINHADSGSSSSTTTTTAVSLEALLLGHEEAVTSLTWRPNQGNKNNKPCLLSSSMDRTILLWMEEKDEDEEDGVGGGVWVPISRVGSAGGILGGSIGASLMGFVDATFSPTDATRIVGHGYGGSIHFWTQVLPEKKKTAVNAIEEEKTEEEEVETEEKIEDEISEEEDINPPQAFEWAPPSGETTKDTPQGAEVENEEDDEEDVLATARWIADPCITGHFRSVEDMAWEPNGEYLLTTSSDQTTRLWTEVPVSSYNQCRWVEVGRPQVHGYDMTSIVCIGGEDDSGMGDGEPCHRFVSGADEKVLRVFDAPSSTLRVLQSIEQARGNNTPEGSKGENQSSSWRVERAFMPSLGLTNKATADPEDQEVSKFGPVDDNDEVAQPLASATTKSTALQYPNVERDLAVTTLWPESRKLFGHESELVCLASYRAPSGSDMSSLVASSCKARNDVESAAIRLWDAKKGKCVGILKGGHRSTVSTMSFSQDGKYLASSGKDRRICIWKRVGDDDNSQDDGGPSYELSAAADSAHKRIVWSVHFCPKRSNILASGSRDGFVKIWRVIEGDESSLEMMEMELCRFEPLSKAGNKNPVTAVAFADDIIKGTTDYGILSIGTESGRIEVWAVPISSSEESTAASTLLYVLPPNESHFDTVKKVAWRPSTTSKEDEEYIVNLTLASCGQDNGVRIFKLAIRKSEAPPPGDVVEEIKEAATNVVESGPKKKLICLVSNGCHDRIQSANQSKALDWFTARKVPHTVVDGMDPEQREMRNKLFGISGIRGNYPQFFFELDGTQTFFGNFQKIEELNETNDIPKELLKQHPEIETWDKVFKDCS